MKQLFGYIPQLLSLVRTNNNAKIISIIMVVLIFLIVGIPLIQRLKRRQIKEKETRNIVKDLMVWRHVAQLAKGGEDQNKAKNLLSDRIEEINFLLNQGFALPAQYKRKPYDLPWYILLGEPRSGKSSFLGNSELELIPSAKEENPASSDGKDSLPVRMWMGAKAVVCDISGHVFFDRWLDGSSAEWNYIIQQLYRKRRKRPLDGIILTIPADAILADDDVLSQKKAILMATELSQLFHTLGMYLPCQVVVTKLDMVDGFREYIMTLPEEMRHQILGFSNNTRLYSTDRFRTFWDALLQRLRIGCKKSMISHELGQRLSGLSSRMDVTGKIYLFPENFATLYKNLDIYLNTLFSENNFHGSRNMIFEGIFFTSSTDLGVTMSQGLAALAEKRVDEFPLTGEKPLSPRSYFTRDLLNKLIFTPSPNAVLTPQEEARHYIPLYAASAALLLTGGVWLGTGILGHGDLSMDLAPAAEYYRSLDESFKNKVPLNNPLIVQDSPGSYVVDSGLVRGLGVPLSKVQYFYQIYSSREQKHIAPWGFKLASLFFFGPDPNMGYGKRAFVHDQIFGVMVRTPVIRNVGNKLLEQQNTPVVLDQVTRNAIHSFLLFSQLSDVDYSRIVALKEFNIPDMISYLIPDISPETLGLLNTFLPRYNRRHTFSMDVAYLDSQEYIHSCQAAMGIMLSTWERLITYPGSMYGKIKSIVLISQRLNANYSRLNQIAAEVRWVETMSQLRRLVAEWKALTLSQTELTNSGRALFDDILQVKAAAAIIRSFSLAGALTGGGTGGLGTIDIFSDNHINDYLFQPGILSVARIEYSGLFNGDMDYLESVIGSIRYSNTNLAVLGRISKLRMDFSSTFSRDLEGLQNVAQTLRNSDLMSRKISDDPKETQSFFSVAERIIGLASAPDLIDPASLQKSEFLGNWQRLQAGIQSSSEAFENYVKPFAENDRVLFLSQGQRGMMQALAAVNRYTVLESGMAIFSSTEPQIAAFVRANAKDDNIFSLSSQALGVLLGDLVYDKSYDPVVVKGLVADLVYFAELVAQYPNPQMRESFGYFREFQAFKSYLDHYIDYWGNFPERAYPPLTDWEEYRARMRDYQSYQINSVLQSLYTKGKEVLSQVDEAVLDEASIKRKNGYIASMNDKIGILSTFFNENTNRMLSAWSRLPADPESAFKTLQQEEPQVLKDTYLIAYSDVKELAVGWWNDFAVNGFKILQDVYYSKRLEEFSRSLPVFKSWPFSADAPVEGALTVKEMGDMAWLLGEMGIDIAPVDAKEPQVILDMRRSLFQGNIAKTWAKTLYTFASAAADRRKPLTWTVNQPPIELQSKLSVPGKMPAVNRFRYIEVSAGRTSRRFTTYEKTETPLAQGNAEEKEIRFRFYVMSGDVAPAFEYTLSRPWVVLSLYLRKDGVLDDQGKRYIPIYLSDQTGEYVYFINLSFSADLPPAEDWYENANWPDVTVSDGMVDAVRPAFSLR
ncbi:MAG: hypothetical protein LBR93_07245 [Treponema sp.]|jgi:hypothetical protein|nr:hypothetical protein [Treponema sp.]